jgi:hypothetical protein
MRRMQVAGVLLLLAAAAGAGVSPRIALASGLAAWWWALGIALGCFANAWMHVLTGGAWGEPVRATALVLSRRISWLLLGLVAVAAAAGQLYPWAMQQPEEWTRGMARPAFVRAWLSPAPFALRLGIYAIAWWWCTRAASLASKGRAAASLVVYAVATTLAAVDLFMSLVPGWYSTAFGLVVMSTQVLSGAAFVVLFAMAGVPSEPRPRVPLSRDLGNLLLMWCMTWGYLAFMQFLVIWSENLPREISWYVPRLQTGWQWVGLALVLAQLALPFLALLFRSVKDDVAHLARVAALLLAASALDCVWTVLPSVDAHDLNAWWIAPLAVAGLALLVFGGLVPGRPPRVEGKLRHA